MHVSTSSVLTYLSGFGQTYGNPQLTLDSPTCSHKLGSWKVLHHQHDHQVRAFKNRYDHRESSACATSIPVLSGRGPDRQIVRTVSDLVLLYI